MMSRGARELTIQSPCVLTRRGPLQRFLSSRRNRRFRDHLRADVLAWLRFGDEVFRYRQRREGGVRGVLGCRNRFFLPLILISPLKFLLGGRRRDLEYGWLQ
jgi:hypothetical protein